MAFTGPDFIAGTPNDTGVSFHIWINNYCRDKPLDLLTQALFALKNKLLARAR